MNDFFQIHDNIVDKEMMQLYYKWTMESSSWFFGRQATLEDNRFWGQKLYESPGPRHFFVEYLEEKFKTVSSINFVTNSAALNGQTSNQQGGWHTDMQYAPDGTTNTSPPDKFLTLLYYVNPIWNDPRGSTIIKKPNGDDLEIKFVPGRIAVFPSSWRHYGDCPAQDNLLRITCALKLEIIENKV